MNHLVFMEHYPNLKIKLIVTHQLVTYTEVTTSLQKILIVPDITKIK